MFFFSFSYWQREIEGVLWSNFFGITMCDSWFPGSPLRKVRARAIPQVHLTWSRYPGPPLRSSDFPFFYFFFIALSLSLWRALSVFQWSSAHGSGKGRGTWRVPLWNYRGKLYRFLLFSLPSVMPLCRFLSNSIQLFIATVFASYSKKTTEL